MKQLLLPAILSLVFSLSLQADELVYTPVNPAFGGNALNGDWLLANAQVQDDHDDPDLESRADKTPGELFNETLERLLVRNVASTIIANISGDDPVLDQLIDLGDFTVIIEQLDDSTLQITTYDEINDVTTIFTSSTVF